ncbi:MAG: metalloregulator ArsR/SmtB family transcription factor [Deltaproteobacteria bacterium]|nr:metalloregulator ArsR/SmtB family transcription factor [Deltaproteobacteria bacterium]MCB9789298.1 metalloregulator ArsR/SmtB family transcription factor [Deltaproteobacteria bacterium]
MPDLNASSELLRLLADPTRIRLLALLEGEALTVAELCQVTGLSQPRVSTHLGRLREAGVVRDRREGSFSWYALAEDGMSEAARRTWALLRETTRDPLLAQDRARAEDVVRARAGGPSWAESVAGQMARHYSPGRTWEALARGVLGLVQVGDVLDVASGDGAVAEMLAPRARSVTCLDLSEKVVAVGRERLAQVPNLRFVRGDMHAIPCEDASFDAALLMTALAWTREPGRVLAECARVLRPGGLLSGTALTTHGHTQAVAAYDHRNSGFEPEALAELLSQAGFEVSLCAPTSRERRSPHFEVLTFHARLPAARC